MYRYLLNLAYIGTNFRGVQKQTSTKLNLIDPLSIQGQVEIALQLMHPVDILPVTISSRTDAGVHALHTTMHVDMKRHSELPYEPTSITVKLNKYFDKEAIPIRILSTFLVPNSFHCRRDAISRTYMYRIVVVKSNGINNAPYIHHVPIEEFNRAMFLYTNTFDVNKIQETSKLFLGLHDFRTFMAKGTKQPNKITRRTINMLDILEVNPNCYSSYSWPYCIYNNSSDYKYYNISCTSSGFLYNQVRIYIWEILRIKYSNT